MERIDKEFHPTQILADFLIIREHFGVFTEKIWSMQANKAKSSSALIARK